MNYETKIDIIERKVNEINKVILNEFLDNLYIYMQRPILKYKDFISLELESLKEKHLISDNDCNLLKDVGEFIDGKISNYYMIEDIVI